MGKLLNMFLVGSDFIGEAIASYQSLVAEHDNNQNALDEDALLPVALKASSGINTIRNILDHAMWEIAKESTVFSQLSPREKRSISFPWHYSEDSFNRWEKKAKELGLYGNYPKIFDMLRSLQPFDIHNMSTFTQSIFYLIALDNASKHKEIIQVSHMISVQSKSVLIYNEETDELEKKLVDKWENPVPTFFAEVAVGTDEFSNGNRCIIKFNASWKSLVIDFPLRWIIESLEKRVFDEFSNSQWNEKIRYHEFIPHNDIL